MKPALRISEHDNVATALEVLDAGRTLEIERATITVSERIPRGHKIAIYPIPMGAPIIKYGSPIGVASIDIDAGAHVHTHNVASSRGRGDLDSSASGAGSRLAEPPDGYSTFADSPDTSRGGAQ